MASTNFITGKSGSVIIGGKTGSRVLEWAINANPTVDANTPIGSSGVRREYTGIVDFTGSVRLQYQKTTSTGALAEPIEAMIKSGGTLSKSLAKFRETSKSMWWGYILFSGISKRQAGDGIQEWTGDWGADGRMHHTSSTATS